MAESIEGITVPDARIRPGTPDKAKAFLRDIILVYERHGLSLAHQDIEGAFIVEKFDRRNIRWLCEASIDLEGHAVNQRWDDNRMTKEQLTQEAERIAENTGIPVETARTMIMIGLRDTKRDAAGRLLADEDDLAEPGDWLTDGESP